MTIYNPPLRDMQFILKEMLRIQNYSNLPGFEEVSEDLIDAILEEGGKFTREVLHPLNPVGDKHGCIRNDDATVTVPPGFQEAYDQMVELGFTAMTASPEYGGQGLPHVLNTAYSEMSTAANMSFSMYPGLTHGAAAAIEVAGSDDQKQLYLPKMISGEWSGTMNLTEPQCGTDLGLIRTKAVPQADGTYKISGQKIWISAGEHPMTKNIIHLVLARIEGAPEGIKGISLFIVPKFIPDANGAPGERNGVSCGGLEEKMGIHGNATCVMNYEDATGYLIGEEHKGMRVMFVMMNAARLHVGVQGLAQADVAYQNAAEFARERVQSRALTGAKAPDKPADPIIVHPDVRRMLMDSRAFIEGGRAFAYWTMLHDDLQHKSPDEKTRERASDYMGLMTPVVKSFLTDKGFKAASDCMQLHGGTGYTQDQGVEQFLRDARIAMIYEGTNGIQALDLVGRKLSANSGRAIFGFFQEIDAWVAENEGDEALKPFIDGLKDAKAKLQEGTMWLMQNGMSDFNNAGAASHDYLNVFGYAALAYMWAKMAKIALANEGSGDPFYKNKLVVGRYFLERLLPEAGAHLVKMKTGASTMMTLDAEAF